MAEISINAAKLAEREGRLVPFIEIDGRWYSMETQESLLDARIVTLTPVTADLEPDHGAQLNGRGKQAPKPTVGANQSLEIIHATMHPGVVALARKAAALVKSGTATAGSLS